MHGCACFIVVPRTPIITTSHRSEKRGRAHLSEDGEALSDVARQDDENRSKRPILDHPRDAEFESKWYAVYTLPRHEKRVEQHLSLRSVDNYLPTFRVQRRWKNGVKVTLDLPLFSGYIFVRINRTERIRVLEVPGVLAIVGNSSSEMTPLPDAEVDALRAGLHMRQAEPHPLLTVGQRARIRSGALAGMEGIVVRKKNSLRVVLTMDLIMQSVSVEVDGSELEQVGFGALFHV